MPLHAGRRGRESVSLLAMKRWIARIIAGLGLAGAILLADAWLFGGRAEAADSPDTATLPAAWQSMAEGRVAIGGDGKDKPGATGQTDARHLDVRVADEPGERAQGMQRLPPAVVREAPIWFAFPQPRRVGWHMHNVELALDIAYVDADGVVIGVERMMPGGSGYGTDAAIAAALELAAGQAEQLGIEPGVRLRLIHR